jgi:hypothetical protein
MHYTWAPSGPCGYRLASTGSWNSHRTTFTVALLRSFRHDSEEFRCLALRYDRPEVLVGTSQVGLE